MYGRQYAKHPEIILDSFRDINETYHKKGKLDLQNPILRFLIYIYINLFGIPDISFQLRAKYFADTLKSLANYHPKQILDAGCGIGYYSQQLKIMYPAAFITGVDTDKHKIKFCQSLAVKDSVFIQGNLMKLSKPEKKYDLIVNIDVLEHINGYSTVLKNFYQMLSPGGHLYIHTPQLNQKRTFKSFFTSWHHEDHVREGFTVNRLTTELKKVGFKHIKYWNGIGSLTSFLWEINQILLSNNFIITGVVFPFLYALTKLENEKVNQSGLTTYILCQK